MEPLTPDDPRTLGPFTLLGRLGAGGMGTVYLGRRHDERLAAVKVVHHHLAADREFRARFSREIALARSVDEPWAARVVAAEPDSARPWLATEYVDGPDLDAHVTTAGPLPPSAVARLATILAGALADLHRRGIVHRDLKPANVLLTHDGARLIDFGIARAVDATRITHTGMVVGTPAYMAPEQADGHDPSPATDVFSLGSVLVYAATGAGPYGSLSNPVAMLVRISRDEPDLDAVPEYLRPLMAECFARDPIDRPAAAALARRFAAICPAAPTPTLVAPVGTDGEPLPLTIDPVPVDRAGGINVVGILAIVLVIVLVLAGVTTVVINNGIRPRTVPAVLEPIAHVELRDRTEPSPLGRSSAAISPDGRWAAVGAVGEIAVVDLRTLAVRHIPAGLTSMSRILEWLPDSRSVYVVDAGGHAPIRLVDTANGTVGAPIAATIGAGSLSLAPDGRTAWFSRPDTADRQVVGQLELASNRVLTEVVLSFTVSDLLVSSDGGSVYVGGLAGGTVIDTRTREQRPMPFEMTGYVSLMSDADGHVAALGDPRSSDPGITFLTPAGAYDRRLRLPRAVGDSPFASTGALARDGGHVFVLDPDGNVTVLSTQDGQEVARLSWSAVDIAVSPDGSRVVAPDTGGNVDVFDTTALAR